MTSRKKYNIKNEKNKIQKLDDKKKLDNKKNNNKIM